MELNAFGRLSTLRRTALDSLKDTAPESESIKISGGVLSFPDDCWYEVQYARSFNTVFEGRNEAQVDPGIYNIINHTTGERFENIPVGTESSGFLDQKSSFKDNSTTLEKNQVQSVVSSSPAGKNDSGWDMAIHSSTRPVSGYDDAFDAAKIDALATCSGLVAVTVATGNIAVATPAGIALLGVECVVGGAAAGVFAYQSQMQSTVVIDGERQTDRHPEDDSTYPANEDLTTSIEARENGDYTVTRTDHLTGTTVVYDHDKSESATTTTTITTNDDGTTETTVDFPDGSGECQVSSPDFYNGSRSENESNSHGTGAGSDYGAGGRAQDANTDETSGYAG